MRDTRGKKKLGHFHIRLTKGNKKGQEDEKEKVKENVINMFRIKLSSLQLRGKAKGERGGRGKQREQNSFFFQGQLS